jgi:hypothetical protein
VISPRTYDESQPVGGNWRTKGGEKTWPRSKPLEITLGRQDSRPQSNAWRRLTGTSRACGALNRGAPGCWGNVMPRLFAIAVALALFVGENATTQSQTPSARQGLEGVWDFSMLTPVQRPPEFADATTRRSRCRLGAASDKREQPRAGIDRDIWFERGQFATLHGPTSLIIDPPDGRMPHSRERQRASVNDVFNTLMARKTDRSTSTCVVSGPPYWLRRQHAHRNRARSSHSPPRSSRRSTRRGRPARYLPSTSDRDRRCHRTIRRWLSTPPTSA